MGDTVSMVDVSALNARFASWSARDIISWFIDQYSGRIALSSSLSIEDQVLTDMVRGVDSVGDRCGVFTLDTGRLFEQSYSLISRTSSHYGVPIKVFFPDHKAVEDMVNKYGINLFYHSVSLRRECCRVRKLEPLSRAFSGLDVWICGLRRGQGASRCGGEIVELDQVNGLIKLNPLMHWSEDDVWSYIRSNGIPYNPLQDDGFRSIGCSSCTRSIGIDDSIRSGRWWWEDSSGMQECGLHR